MAIDVMFGSEGEPQVGTRMFRALAFWLCLACAVVLGYLFYTGLFCSDDTRYMAGIVKLASGHPIDLASNAERRLLFLLPGLLGYVVGNTRLDAAIAVYVLAYVTMPVLAWSALRRHGPSAATGGALLCVLTPLLYRYAGAMLPDVLSAALCSFLMLLCLKWDRARRIGVPRARLAFWIGVISLLAVSVKESNAVVAALGFAWVGLHVLGSIPSRTEASSAIAIISGSILFLFSEAVLYRVFSGTWHVGLMNSASSHDFSRFVSEQGLYPGDRLWTLANLLDVGTLVVVACAIVASVYLVLADARRRVRDPYGEWLIPLVFFIWPLLYFSIGTTSLTAYVPPVMQERYFAPCVPSAAVLIVVASRNLPQWLGVRAPVVVVSVICIFLIGRVPFEFDARGTMYWARSKDSFALALDDLARRAPGLRISHVRMEKNSEIMRCRDLLIRQSWNDDLVNDAPVDPPFLMVGVERRQLSQLDGPWGDRVRHKLATDDWALGLVGYYYADTRADNGYWWLPRQLAVRRAFQRDPKRFRKSNYPDGYVPWVKREMRAEVYLLEQRHGPNDR